MNHKNNINKCCETLINVVNKPYPKLLIVITILNISVINVVPTKFINYNITLLLIYVLIYTYVYLKINILDVVFQMHFMSCLPGWPASGWQYKSHTKITFFFKKNVVGHMTFTGRPTMSAQTNCVCIVHVRAIIFCTCNQMIFIINNIKKVFK